MIVENITTSTIFKCHHHTGHHLEQLNEAHKWVIKTVISDNSTYSTESLHKESGYT